MTGSFGLNFLTGFTKYTVLPSFVAALATLPIMLLLFWNKIPKVITPVILDPRAALTAPWSAVYFSVLLILTIAVLVGTSFAGNVHVWMVTAPAGILGLAHNIISDLFLPAPPAKPALEDREDANPPTPSSASNQPNGEKIDKEEPLPHNPDPKDHSVNMTVARPPFTMLFMAQALAKRFPRTALTVKRLPIPLLPFAMCQFILVRALLELGWIRVFASGFIRACNTPVQSAFFSTIITACFLCPFAGTNIGATILMVEIL